MGGSKTEGRVKPITVMVVVVVVVHMVQVVVWPISSRTFFAAQTEPPASY